MREAGATAYDILERDSGPGLAAALDLLADTRAGGAPKFAPSVCRQVARAVVCRSYGPALHELAHLVVVAEACDPRPGRYESLFWQTGPARASAFRGFVEPRLLASRRAADRVAISPPGVEIAYADGSFAIAFSRMPFLSALLEFLVTAIGYGELDTLLSTLFRGTSSRRHVSETANRLSKRLYAYLGENLSPVQQQRKFLRLIAYLVRREGGCAPDAIDDGAILDFWLAQGEAEAPGSADGECADFKTFAAVFRAFLRLRQALEAVRDKTALKLAQPIGTDRELGEVDPAAVTAAVDTIDEAVDPVVALGTHPACGIKFLTKKEMAEFALLVTCGRLARALLLSVMRHEVFVPAQARVTEGLRRGLRGAALRDLIADDHPESYEARRKRYESLGAQLEKILLACLHVLLQSRSPEAFEVLLALRPETDVSRLTAWLGDDQAGETVVRPRGRLLERVFQALERPEAVGPDLAGVVQEAKRAHRSTTRKGFSGNVHENTDDVAAFIEAAAPLIDLHKRLGAFRRDLARAALPDGDWPAQFAADHGTFRDQFLELYGKDV